MKEIKEQYLKRATFTDYISKINNTQIDNAKYIDVVMPTYNLIEYSDNYLKTSGSLWQCYRDNPRDNITRKNRCYWKYEGC